MALNEAKGGQIPVNRKLKDHPCAFAQLVADVGCCPTHLAEIVPQDPSCLGATDAAKAGMGGVHCEEGGPCVWQVALQVEVQDMLVSADDLTGTITNSDLERTGMLAQVSTTAARHPVKCANVATFVDNTPLNPG